MRGSGWPSSAGERRRRVSSLRRNVMLPRPIARAASCPHQKVRERESFRAKARPRQVQENPLGAARAAHRERQEGRQRRHPSRPGRLPGRDRRRLVGDEPRLPGAAARARARPAREDRAGFRRRSSRASTASARTAARRSGSSVSRRGRSPSCASTASRSRSGWSGTRPESGGRQARARSAAAAGPPGGAAGLGSAHPRGRVRRCCAWFAQSAMRFEGERAHAWGFAARPRRPARRPRRGCSCSDRCTSSRLIWVTRRGSARR